MATQEKPEVGRDVPQGTAYGRPPQHPDHALTQVGPGTPMGELMRRYWQLTQSSPPQPLASLHIRPPDWVCVGAL